MFLRALSIFALCIALTFGMRLLNHTVAPPSTTPLAQQRFQQMQVIAWLKNALNESFTFDTANYKEKFKAVQVVFQPQAYEQFGEIIAKLGVIQIMQTIDVKVIASTPEFPKLTASGVTDNVYEWAVNIDVLLDVIQNNEPQKVPLRFRVLVRQTSIEQSATGLIIGSIQPLGLNEGARFP